MKFPPAQPNENLTAEQKAEFVLLLTAGLDRLWDGKDLRLPASEESFVCFTLPITAADLCDLIHARINSYCFVTSWYLDAAGVDLATAERRQAYRKAWMESMIKEFSQ